MEIRPVNVTYRIDDCRNPPIDQSGFLRAYLRKKTMKKINAKNEKWNNGTFTYGFFMLTIKMSFC